MKSEKLKTTEESLISRGYLARNVTKTNKKRFF